MLIVDSHTHFFSYEFFRLLVAQKQNAKSLEEELALLHDRTGISIPPVDHAEHARAWKEKLDANGIHHAVIFSSAPGEETAVAQTEQLFPDIFTCACVCNPKMKSFPDVLKRNIVELKYRGLLLFPSMHHYHVYDDVAAPVFEAAEKYGLPVVVQFGILNIPLRKHLALSSPFDGTYAVPTDLHRVAIRYPSVKMIIPHFGAGYFRETLMLGAQCPNVFVDTSSANGWLKLQPFPLDLKTIFEKTLLAFGPERILFGTDSGSLPRGYRDHILKAQMDVCASLDLSGNDMANIFGRNAMKVYQLKD